VDSNGRTIWIAEAYRGDGKRFVVRADEKLTAVVELEAAFALVCALAVLCASLPFRLASVFFNRSSENNCSNDSDDSSCGDVLGRVPVN
jgi:hypothetical protein